LVGVVEPYSACVVWMRDEVDSATLSARNTHGHRHAVDYLMGKDYGRDLRLKEENANRT